MNEHPENGYNEPQRPATNPYQESVEGSAVAEEAVQRRDTDNQEAVETSAGSVSTPEPMQGSSPRHVNDNQRFSGGSPSARELAEDQPSDAVRKIRILPPESLNAADTPSGRTSIKRVVGFAVILTVAVLIVIYGIVRYMRGASHLTSRFEKAFRARDYTEIAGMVSAQDRAWRPEEIEAVCSTLEGTDISAYLDGLTFSEQSSWELRNGRGTTVFQMVRTGTDVPFIPRYALRIPDYVLVLSSDHDITVSLDDMEYKVAAHTPLELERPLIGSVLRILDSDGTSVDYDLPVSAVENNRLLFVPDKDEYRLQLVLPEKIREADTTGALHIDTVHVNGDDYPAPDDGRLIFKTYRGRKLSVTVVVTVDKESYTSKEVEVVAEKSGNIRIDIDFSEEDVAEINETFDVLKEKEASKRRLAQNRDAIENFIKNARTAIFDSMGDKQVRFADYFMENCERYRNLSDYIKNGDAKAQKIDYYEDLGMEILSMWEDGEDVVVETKEQFRIHYTDDTEGEIQLRAKTYVLQKGGVKGYKIKDETTSE
ncbi:MAG: hypothetical protein Q4P30_02450 [Eubacteriales bacterium]|nr:hypothetical protein [Eubacteriales bacterium]